MELPIAMIKNFEPKTRKWFRSIIKAIFKYDLKQLVKSDWDRDAIKEKK